MVIVIRYNTVKDVETSFERLKNTRNHKERMGNLILTRLLELEPSARALFGFSDAEDISQNTSFELHANAMWDMIDTAVAFLGPDMDSMKEDLRHLGKRHLALGVKPNSMFYFEKSVLYALDEI
jgi:hypothetical protein